MGRHRERNLLHFCLVFVIYLALSSNPASLNACITVFITKCNRIMYYVKLQTGIAYMNWIYEEVVN